MAPAAFSELLAAVKLIERGAMHSVVAESSLVGDLSTYDLNLLLLNLRPQPMVHEMRNKAIAVYTASRPLDIALYPRNAFGHSSPFGYAVALPCLIPGVMQPPLTPNSWWT
jgi:hypothetical protein